MFPPTLSGKDFDSKINSNESATLISETPSKIHLKRELLACCINFLSWETLGEYSSSLVVAELAQTQPSHFHNMLSFLTRQIMMSWETMKHVPVFRKSYLLPLKQQQQGPDRQIRWSTSSWLVVQATESEIALNSPHTSEDLTKNNFEADCKCWSGLSQERMTALLTYGTVSRFKTVGKKPHRKIIEKNVQ